MCQGVDYSNNLFIFGLSHDSFAIFTILANQFKNPIKLALLALCWLWLSV